MKERTAIVTGAAGTIGQGAVVQLLRQGRRVVLADREADKLGAAARQCAEYGEVMEVVADLADESAPSVIAAAIAQRGWEPAGILVNNAGITIKHDGIAHGVIDVSVDEWELMFRINVTASMLMAKMVLPAMKERGWGRIVNIASRAGRYNPNQAGPAYTASKAAVLGLTRSIANDYSKHGITCNSIAPGFVVSAMTGLLTPQLLQALVDRTPVGRGGSADELGSAIAYLASEDAGFISGACLDVNGGQTMS